MALEYPSNKHIINGVEVDLTQQRIDVLHKVIADKERENEDPDRDRLSEIRNNLR